MRRLEQCLWTFLLCSCCWLWIGICPEEYFHYEDFVRGKKTKTLDLCLCNCLYLSAITAEVYHRYSAFHNSFNHISSKSSISIKIAWNLVSMAFFSIKRWTDKNCLRITISLLPLIPCLSFFEKFQNTIKMLWWLHWFAPLESFKSKWIRMWCLRRIKLLNINKVLIIEKNV